MPVPTLRARNDLGQYDDLADAWWDERGPFAMLHWLAAARAALVPPASRPDAILVDLGCGGGLLAPHLAGKGYHHVGVDLTTSALRQAHDHGAAAVCADVAAVPLQTGSADVVCAGEILEHVVNTSAVLDDACRVLRTGGTLVIDTIADTRLATLVAVELAERVPAAPAGIHDPNLFVNRAAMIQVCADHGVALEVRGVRPSWLDLMAWAAGRRNRVRMVPTFTSAVLFQAWGTKRP
jgi:2-polyprenyl-6-hydroxyphenyl methylase/3-demethylubiquinone-9 3-methyltransferase